MIAEVEKDLHSGFMQEMAAYPVYRVGKDYAIDVPVPRLMKLIAEMLEEIEAGDDPRPEDFGSELWDKLDTYT